MIKDLKLERLAEIDDGRIAAAFDDEIGKIVEDLNDRPGDKTARSVTVKLSFVPHAPGGAVDDVSVDFEITSKIPKKRSKTYSMAVHGTRRLVFNDVSTDDVRQGTLDQVDKPTAQ